MEQVLHNETTIELYLSRAEELLGREEEVSSAWEAGDCQRDYNIIRRGSL